MGHSIKVLIEDDDLHTALLKFAREIFLSIGRDQISSIMETEISRICEKDYVERIAPQLASLNSSVLQAEIMKFLRSNEDIKKEMKKVIASRIDAADFGVNMLALIDKRVRELIQNEYECALTELAEKQAELNATCASAMRMLDEVRALKTGTSAAVTTAKSKRQKKKQSESFAEHMGH